ncbi:helix-turn-helix domain-containing protein [Bradyrhizobium sp. SRS-191]|uniref:AraC-like ligand-binding domain-containing protein n=1 Tax=Bradyrhizobium sp. SRS-191 TaxID=2962606 RepID=UPI00211EF20C|nr:helix-turn-helix domain-containing protein [Bradyrhizobium sp. SRS-191]
MRMSFTTSDVPRPGRPQYWQDIVSQTYFPLDLRFASGSALDGHLQAWTLGPLSMSRNVCDGLLYRRRKHHLVAEREESFLVTIPDQGEIRFVQDGKDVRCRPGAFLVERSHLPYEFSHDDPAALWVIKIPRAVMRTRIACPERLATLQFDATRGVGALFVDTLRLLALRLDEMSDAARAVTGTHLLELLAMAVEADDRLLTGHASPTRNAHLHRCEHFIRTHLHDIRLAPQLVADRCGISLRYLHQIFEAEGITVCSYIRNQRLAACDAALRDPRCRNSIADIAYRWGYGDQAQLSRHYRSRFGRSPSEARAAYRASAP